MSAYKAGERDRERERDEKDVELMVIIHHTDFEKCGEFCLGGTEAEFGSKRRNDSQKGWLWG